MKFVGRWEPLVTGYIWGKERAAQVDFALIFEVRVDEIEELSRLRRTRVKGY